MIFNSKEDKKITDGWFHHVKIHAGKEMHKRKINFLK